MKFNKEDVYGYKAMMRKIKKIEDILEILEKAEKPLLAREISYKLQEIGYMKCETSPISIGLFINYEMRKWIDRKDVPCDYTIKINTYLGYQPNKNGYYDIVFGEKEITPKQKVYSIK